MLVSGIAYVNRNSIWMQNLHEVFHLGSKVKWGQPSKGCTRLTGTERGNITKDSSIDPDKCRSSLLELGVLLSQILTAVF